jgi:hypothetical protein
MNTIIVYFLSMNQKFGMNMRGDINKKGIDFKWITIAHRRKWKKVSATKWHDNCF